MQLPDIPPDDLIDIAQLTESIENCIYHILEDNDLNLAFSSLISAFINYLIDQCSTLDEIIYYRNLFVKIIDYSISRC